MGEASSAGVALENANNVVGSYYFDGADVGVGSNADGAVDFTKALTNAQLTRRASYEAFDFV
ncbi:MAG: hypothetical protein IJ087_23045 [Eggerthellaceae bacterium]|nr:hypothetical protein [Eggerthellaceae bacterium]